MAIKQEIEQLIRDAAREFDEREEVPLEHPENADYGDYATSVAFSLAKQSSKNPQEIAAHIASTITNQQSTILDKVEAIGGFVNFTLSKKALFEQFAKVGKQKEGFGKSELLKGRNIMVEYAHPNTHKEMHIGHMRTLVTGEALCRILESAGATVFRANYQGDIGPHVAKAIWGTEKLLGERNLSWQKAEDLSLSEKAHLLGEGYVKGSQEYEQNKQEIDALNVQLYRQDEEVGRVYERTRIWSLAYYDSFYDRFGTRFDKLYFESQVAELGKNIVLENLGKVFEKSEGATVFKGEKYGLHTRVFVTQDGNPTYEGKEMGLAPAQYKDFPFDLNIHVVANEQSGYFQVVFKALELIDEKFKGKEYHLPMGMVQLVGKKMSSRTGVLVTVDGLLDDVKELLSPLITNEDLMEDEFEEIKEVGTVAAVKYSVLKTDTKANALFDLARSVALDGNSGLYLLYTYARCRSILRKSQATINNKQLTINNISKEEMDILRTLYKFPELVEEAAEKYAPNLVCNFVFDLAQKYNAFYNVHSVLQAETENQKEFRLQLTAACAQVIKNSLHLLGIQTLEKM